MKNRVFSFFALIFSQMLFVGLVHAAPLSDPQKITLKAAALADPTAAAYITAGDDSGLQGWFNTSTACVVWRTSLSAREIYEKVSTEGTTWNWTTYIANTTAAERDAWREMANLVYPLNPSLQNVRDGWDKIFSGAGAAVVAQRAHLSAIAKRAPTKAEQILATGPCSLATLGWEGTISGTDVIAIRNAP